MALRRLSISRGLLVCLLVGFVGAPMTSAASEPPSILHGVGEVIGGIFLDWPKAILQATAVHPPVIGTTVGIIAGACGAVQHIVNGLKEVAVAFNPWGISR